MKIRAQPLSPQESTAWARRAQIAALEGLMTSSAWTCQQVAFHGGTSLHLSWQSPRFSEDLDFLLSNQVQDVEKTLEEVRAQVQLAFDAIDPAYVVELKNKTRDAGRLPRFDLLVGHPAYMGKARIKLEFWRVDEDYLAQYPTTFRSPLTPGDMVSEVAHPVPAGTLVAAFCDKLTAFATRPHLKWRDIYDLWWIGTQSNTPLDTTEVVAQFLHNLSAYSPVQDLSPAMALRLFLKRDVSDLLKAADTDLQPWLPPSLWKNLQGRPMEDMVGYVRQVLSIVAEALENKSTTVQIPSTAAPKP